MVAFVDKSTLLETTRTDTFKTETKNSVKTRILFETGIQLYYINDKVRKHLSLKTFS